MSEFPVELMQVPQYDPDDPAQVAAVQEAAQLRDLQHVEMVKSFLGTYEGRAFVWMLMQASGMDESTFVGEAPMTMAYNEGRREMGRWGKDWVFTSAPETYSIMRREAIQREQEYAHNVGLGIQSEE